MASRALATRADALRAPRAAQARVVEREIHAAAAAEAQRAAERSAAKSLRLRCDRARVRPALRRAMRAAPGRALRLTCAANAPQARSVLYVLGAGPPGAAQTAQLLSPAQAHAQDAADAAREALEALRALRS